MIRRMDLVFFRGSNSLKMVDVEGAGFEEEAELASVCMCVSEWVGACVKGDLQMPLPLERQFVARACEEDFACAWVGRGTGHRGVK